MRSKPDCKLANIAVPWAAMAVLVVTAGSSHAQPRIGEPPVRKTPAPDFEMVSVYSACGTPLVTRVDIDNQTRRTARGSIYIEGSRHKTRYEVKAGKRERVTIKDDERIDCRKRRPRKTVRAVDSSGKRVFSETLSADLVVVKSEHEPPPESQGGVHVEKVRGILACGKPVKLYMDVAIHRGHGPEKVDMMLSYGSKTRRNKIRVPAGNDYSFELDAGTKFDCRKGIPSIRYYVSGSSGAKGIVPAKDIDVMYR